MRRDTKNRTTLSFASSDQRDLVMGLARNEVAMSDGLSMSSWIIDTILDHHGLSGDDYGTRLYARPLFMGVTSIADCLEGLYRANAAGVHWRSAHDNARPLVDYGRRLALDWGLSYDSRSGNAVHAIGCIDSMARKIEKVASETMTADLVESANYARALGEEIKVAGEYLIPASNIFGLVVDAWDAIGGYTYTYRLLGDIVEGSVGWRDVDGREPGASSRTSGALQRYRMVYTPDVAARRKELAKVVRDVCASWDGD